MEQIDQIDKLPPSSKNIMKYFCVANEMQMVDR